MGDGDWIRTWSGRAFRPLDPDPEQLDVRDIAHALSLLCRFNGHCARFYSVAEHCVRASLALPPELALYGLLHDAAEAYLSDVPRPLKRRLPGYGEAEDRLLRVILERFGLSWPVPAEVWRVDTALLAAEVRDLMPPGTEVPGVAPLPGRIEPWPAERAERAFLERFDALA